MPSIHINPEELRNASRLLELKAREMQDEDFRLRQAGAALDMAWSGGSSSEFRHDLESMQHHLRVRIQEVYSMAQKLNREADRWEESDQTWVEEIRRIFGFIFRAGGK